MQTRTVLRIRTVSQPAVISHGEAAAGPDWQSRAGAAVVCPELHCRAGRAAQSGHVRAWGGGGDGWTTRIGRHRCRSGRAIRRRRARRSGAGTSRRRSTSTRGRRRSSGRRCCRRDTPRCGCANVCLRADSVTHRDARAGQSKEILQLLLRSHERSALLIRQYLDRGLIIAEPQVGGKVFVRFGDRGPSRCCQVVQPPEPPSTMVPLADFLESIDRLAADLVADLAAVQRPLRGRDYSQVV